MLYLVGLGLCDPSDITVKGLEVVKKASKVYLEAYTSVLIASSKEDLVRGESCNAELKSGKGLLGRKHTISLVSCVCPVLEVVRVQKLAVHIDFRLA